MTYSLEYIYLLNIQSELRTIHDLECLALRTSQIAAITAPSIIITI